MRNLKALSLIERLSNESDPSILEIVDLFHGLLVKTIIKNYVRVILSKYADNPLEPGTNPSRFSCLTGLNQPEKTSLAKISYGAQTIDTAIYVTVLI